MATWAELVTFIRREYEVIGDEPDELTILFRYDPDEQDDPPGRSQMVAVVRETFDRRWEWAQIASPFARVGQVDLQEVLEEVGNTTVVGGVAIIGEFLMLRHSLPLINLDLNEFVDPLIWVTKAADRMELQFVRKDNF